MAIKDLFEKSSTGVITSTSLEEEIVANNSELESTENIEEQRKRISRFIPHVDFSNPANFARYGSAESYYKDGIARIYNQYPYDGSEREIQQFLNESNPIDLYIFENKYPRTTGYAVLAADGWGTQDSTVGGFGKPSLVEYISFKGGPHTSSGGIATGSLKGAFGEPTYRTSPNSNIYDADIYGTAEVDALGREASRESNLKFDISKGVTTEFFLRKGDWITNLTHKEVIFDLWNGQNTSSATDESYAENKGYGRLLIYLTGSGNASGDDVGPGGTNPFRVHLASGSSVWDMSFGGATTTTASLSGTWNHVAFSFFTENDPDGTLPTDQRVTAKFYLNGKIQETQINTDFRSFGEVTGSLIGFIGALQTQPSGNSFDATVAGSMVGDGKLSASLDEFRYWKTKRTEKDIQNNWWTQVRGGTNTDISNSDLGVYFKFNEGVTGTSSVDQTVLDYSGRISNGHWTGYPSLNARNLGSAIVSSSATVSGTTEFKDPIIYPEHSDVTALFRTYGDSGSAHDHSNVSSLMDSMPSWIVEEDESKSGDLKKLTQIIGSYFDTLHLQIEHLPKLSDVNYPSASFKPLPFSDRLLSSFGLHAPETFVEASILERFANRKDDREYSLDINDVKNQIYQNIYNNLSFIYKSKGTEKSFRNLIRCYGVDEEVIKLNVYGNNSTFKFEDTHYDATVRKNYIDFNHPDRFDGVVYQRPSNNSETTAISYISGTNASFANTAEVEIIFPRKMEFSNPQYFITPFVSCSLFGAHTPSASAGNFVWPVGSDDYGFQLYFIKTAEESKDGKFLLTTRTGDFTLTSSVYSNVYDNQKWNFAIRTKDGKYPHSNGITGSISNTAGLTSSAVDSTNVTLEFVGYNVDLGVTRNEFFLTASGLSDKYLTEARRYYAGASRTNTTGAVETRTDVRASSIRHYAHYLENAAIIAHAKDPDNYGVQHPNKNTIFATNDASISIDNSDLPEYASLALNWDFAQVTGSDSSGEFIVEDASSGSVALYTRYSSDGNYSHIVANQYAGRGYFPSALSDSSVVDKNYVPAAKQRLPEVVNSGDAVNVLRQDDDLYPSDPAVSQTFFAFEKSMYGVVSQEMINTFATIVEFNNLVGEVTNKYRDGYKGFNRLRTLFFEKIENNPDLDKFIDYYKWIDNSLSVMIQQLVPASAEVADEIRNVVESHIMERSKYRHQVPLLDYKGNSRWGGDEALLEARAFGINELTYNWKFGHAPVSSAGSASLLIERYQGENALWWKERAERTHPSFFNETPIHEARKSLNDIMLSFNSASYLATFTKTDGDDYHGSAYALRRFSTPVRMKIDVSNEIRSGHNFAKTQRPDAIAGLVQPFSSDEIKVDTESFKTINAEETGDPIVTVKRKFVTKTTSPLGLTSTGTNLRSKHLSPISHYSSSLGTKEISGLHADSYGDSYETPMQGPFTEQHVGGYFHRHVRLNRARTRGDEDASVKIDNVNYRPEAWELTGSPRNTFTTRSSAHQPQAYANYQRNVKAKRPVNIRNIKMTSSSPYVNMTGTVGLHPGTVIGNYRSTWEVVQTSGRSANNSTLVSSGGYGSASIVSPLIYDQNDYAKPDRGRTEHVFINRFSAPGGPETAGDADGGPFLDLESAEYSPYNSLNYRNLSVRVPLQTLLTERSERFGLRSGSSVSSTGYLTNTTASYHKINRNQIRRLKESSVNAGHPSNTFLVTASIADNYYVQHPIPQSDYQYTWVTASLGTSSVDIYGYLPADGLIDRGVSAVTTISVDDGDEDNAFSELEQLTIIATDGTSVTFTICDANQSDITAGTVMEEGSDYGSAALGSGAAQIGTIALPVHLTGVKGSKNAMLNVLKTAFMQTELKGKIHYSADESDVDGIQTRTLIQVDAGYAGNTTLTTDIDSLTVTRFTGGRDKRLVSALTTVSASDFVSSLVLGARAFGVDKFWKDTYVETLWTDFVGMNTNVIDLVQPRNFLLTGTNHGSTMNLSPLVNGPTTNGPAALLNATLLHRNGPYGHPTFKQIRVGQSALGRYYRNRNIYTNTLMVGEAFDSKIGALTETIVPRRGQTIATTQSVVTKRFHPVKQEIVVMTGEGRNKQIPRTMMVQSSYGNNIAYFDDPTFASKLGIKINKGYSAYDTVKNLYLNGGVEDPSSPVVGVNRVLYSETVWPSSQNAYTEKIRGRTGYTNNFWRDKESDRITLASNTKKYFAGQRLSQSSWPLDGYENFVSNTTVTNLLSGTSGHGKGSEHNVEYKAGILQNQFTHVHFGDVSASWAGPLYARKHMFPTTASVCPIWGMVDHSSLENMEGLLTTHTDNTTAWPDTPDSKQWLPAESLFRGEALWEANLHAGRFDATSGSFITSSVNPFKDSYDEWFADIKAKGQDYSVIPEFRITDHLDFYSTLGNDYTTENESMLSIVGASTSSAYPQNSSEENFFTIFTNSDFMKHFEVIRNDHRNELEPKAISLQCKAIKKFIPYDGFYPAERTVDLTEQFINSYGEYVQYQKGTQGLEQNQYVRNFIKPLFSPGILFNTIKSGLAVDYPIMQDSSFLRFASVDLTDDDQYDHDSYLGKATSGSFAIFGNSVATTTGQWYQGWDKRIPFEALIEPEKYLAGQNISDDEPSDQARVDAVVKWSGEGDQKYKYMAHNFFAECANFFLKGGKTTGLSSAPETEFKNVTPGQIYGMRVKIWRSMEKPKVTGSWGNFYVPQNTKEPREGFGRTPGSFGGLAGASTQNKETFTMYSRPSAFGPPLGLQVSTTSSLSGSEYDFGPRNGIYGSHTPPYYDGESWVDLIYFPVGLEAITRDGGADQGGTDSATGKALDIFALTSGTLDSSHDSYQPTLNEIFNLNDGSVFETSASNVALNGTFMRKWRYDQEELRRNEAFGHGGTGEAGYPFESGTYGKTGNPSIGKYAGLYGPAAGPWMNEWAMQGDASLNMFDKVQVSDGTKWRIQTKFETPMLNFNQVSVGNGTLTLHHENSASAAVPRGMWHQFGRMPKSDEGVYMQVTEIPSDWLENHPSASLIWDMAAKYKPDAKKSPRIDGEQHVTDFYKGYSVPVGTHDSLSTDSTTIINPGISSLVDVCGFSTDPVRIGEVADKKVMKEAIVAVPFTIEEGDRKFFTVANPLSENYGTLSGPSVKKQVSLMEEYVFPPSLDFVRNTELPAIAMYIFEFKHTFDADDLSHMWQNLPPRLGNAPQETDVSISHRLVADEIMGNYKELEDRIVRTDTNSEGAANFITPVDDEIRWMVFKVKQRAKTNYYDALRGKAAEKAAVEIPDYTHNWPYDFCSLVELAKLDVEIELGRPEDEGISGSPILKGQAPELIPPGSTLSAASAAAAASGGSVGGGSGGGGSTGASSGDVPSQSETLNIITAAGGPSPDSSLAGSDVSQFETQGASPDSSGGGAGSFSADDDGPSGPSGY